MSELSRELFLLDIESAVRDLMAVDGLISDQNTNITRLVEDLTGLLFSLSQDDLARCGVELLRKVSAGNEPARLRRIIREYCELISSWVNSFRTGEDNQGLTARLAVLRQRITELGSSSADMETEIGPVSVGLRVGYCVDSPTFDGQINDELTDRTSREFFVDPVVDTVMGTLRDASEIVSSIVATSDQQIDQPLQFAEPQEVGIHGSEPTEVQEASDPNMAVSLGAFIVEKGSAIGPASIAPREKDALIEASWDFVPLANLGRRIDRAFVSAVANVQSFNWQRGSRELLELIDCSGHEKITRFIPERIRLSHGQEIHIDGWLGRNLGKGLDDSKVDGVARAVITSNTLILTISFENLISVNNLAKMLSALGGRLEVDNRDKRIQIVVPSSRRLLRFLPIEVGGERIAISWSQYLPEKTEGFTQRSQVKLLIGNELDALNVDTIGKDEVGVFYPIPNAIRKHDRFRGLVLAPTASYFPVYG